MSIITLAAFVGGFLSGFVAGVVSCESGNVRSSDLTALSNSAIGKVKSAFTYLKPNEHRSQQEQNGASA